jgi:F0F1-type ATP synthase assembly protein I
MTEEPPKRNTDYIHYSSAGIQMVLTILIFTFLGTRLDKYFETSKPLWTAFLAIFGVVVAMIFMIKKFMNPPSKKKDDKNKEQQQ